MMLHIAQDYVFETSLNTCPSRKMENGVKSLQMFQRETMNNHEQAYSQRVQLPSLKMFSSKI